RIVVGDLAVSAAAWWNPRLKLPSTRPALLPEGVRQLRNALYGEGVPHSAFTLPGLPIGPGGPLAALRGAVRRADLDAALRTATRLIGLGPGLTPAGDDVMAGTMAGLVLLGHPAAERFAAGVDSLAAGRTADVSRSGDPPGLRDRFTKTYNRQACMLVTRIARAPSSHSSSITRLVSPCATMARTADQPGVCNGLTVGPSRPGVIAVACSSSSFG